MPTLGGDIPLTADENYGISAFGYTQDMSGLEFPIPQQHVVSLVPDETFFPDQASAANSSLRDLTEGQDWFLRRIVGKVWVGCSQTSPTQVRAMGVSPGWPSFLCGAAFFVARAKDDDPETPDLEVREYDPLGAENIRQPWIWRRTWLLTDFGIQDVAGTPHFSLWPSSNMLNTGGGVLDGPHLDAKTARRIRREERLWFTTSVVPFNYFVDDGNGANVSGTAQQAITWNLDYRILGQLRKSKNASAF